MSQSKKLPFRFDINALRAIAVISVVLYHFQVPGFGGGFVGVDVFFVISGFLMTQIIYGQLSEQRFNISAFYAARIRRIVPALILLGVALLLFGYFFLIPYDYTILGKRVLTSLGFVSNIALLHKAPYFDPASREQWLLHTWSLSVEAQFYLVWPFLLMFLQKQKRNVKPYTLAVFALSLLWCIFKTEQEASAAFYSLPTRVWEFMAGGIVYLFRQQLEPRKYMVWAGTLFVLLADFFYTGDLGYPGYWAVLPVAGAALFIAAQSDGVLIQNRVVQFFGDISYSLYLWHWPVFVAAKYFDADFTPLNVAGLISLAALLAYISFEYVEKPMRYKMDWKVSFGTGAVIALGAYAIFALHGLPFRVPQNVIDAENSLKDSNQRRVECMFNGNIASPPECRLGATIEPSVAIWGDSHADALFPVLDRALAQDQRSAFFYAYGGCPPILGTVFSNQTSHRQGSGCKAFNDLVLTKILSRSTIKDVMLIGRWSFYLEGGLDDDSLASSRATFDEDRTTAFKEKADSNEYAAQMIKTMCMLTQHKKDVYVVAPIPEMPRNVPAYLAKSRLLGRKDIVIEATLSDYAARHGTVLKALATAEKQCHVHILDPKPYLCGKTVCLALKEGKPIYRDSNHLSTYGSLLLEPLFLKSLRTY